MTRVKRIEDNCYRGNNEITEIIIPTHITQFGKFSFANCTKLTKVIIPESIKIIPYCCFDGCYELKEIEMPKEIQLKNHCFCSCELLKGNKQIPDEFIEEIKIGEDEDENKNEYEDEYYWN